MNSSCDASSIFRRVFTSNVLVSTDDVPGKVSDCVFEESLSRDDLIEERPEAEGCNAFNCALNPFILELGLDDFRVQLQSTRLFADVELVILLYASLAFIWLFLLAS